VPYFRPRVYNINKHKEFYFAAHHPENLFSGFVLMNTESDLIQIRTNAAVPKSLKPDTALKKTEIIDKTYSSLPQKNLKGYHGESVTGCLTKKI
jgi:hypothetical protein